jgi:hypothetical protein
VDGGEGGALLLDGVRHPVRTRAAVSSP